MPHTIKPADYFYTMIHDRPGEAYKVLTHLATHGVSLLGFAAVPMGPARTQLTLFPGDDGKLIQAAEKSGLVLEGPHPALLVQGDDELGALAGIHAKLADASVSVFASSGLAGGQGSFTYVLYLRPEDLDRAEAAVGS